LNNVIITTSWDDGHPLDLKLGSLLQKYDMPGTFYVPINNPENPVLTSNQIKKLSEKFEIGGHTLNHSVLTNLSLENIKKEVNSGKAKLEEICGPVLSFAYPRGQYNLEIKKIVKKNGFLGARTAEIMHHNLNDHFEMHPTVHVVERSFLSKGKQFISSSDSGLANYVVKHGFFLKNWEWFAKKSLDYVIEHGGIWHLWGHSWEIDNHNIWSNLENILSYVNEIGCKNGCEFLTNGEIFEKFKD
jgi:peptidoglycan-N-acetylglucosamine deacetylase